MGIPIPHCELGWTEKSAWLMLHDMVSSELSHFVLSGSSLIAHEIFIFKLSSATWFPATDMQVQVFCPYLRKIQASSFTWNVISGVNFWLHSEVNNLLLRCGKNQGHVPNNIHFIPTEWFHPNLTCSLLLYPFLIVFFLQGWCLHNCPTSICQIQRKAPPILIWVN